MTDEERRMLGLPISSPGMPGVTGIGGPAITTQPIFKATAAPAIGSGPAIPTVGPAPTGKPIGPAPAITRPNLTAPAITGTTTTAPVMRNSVTAPTMPAQQQQAISGDVFSRVLPSIKQYEATTGRAISGKALKAFSEQEYETAANRAAQNKQLALQEYGLGLQKYSTDLSAETAANSQALQKYGIDVNAEQNTQQMLLQKYGIDTNADLQTQQLQLQKYGVETTAQLQQQDQDLRRFGMDSQNLFQGAQMALQKYGMDADIAIRQYAQELQEKGMAMDEAYRYADMALRKELGYAGIEAQKDMANQMAESAAMGQLIGLGGMLGANYMTNETIKGLYGPTSGTAAAGAAPAVTASTVAAPAAAIGGPALAGGLPAAGTGALGTGAVGSGTLGTAHAGTGATAAAMDGGVAGAAGTGLAGLAVPAAIVGIGAWDMGNQEADRDRRLERRMGVAVSQFGNEKVQALAGQLTRNELDWALMSEHDDVVAAGMKAIETGNPQALQQLYSERVMKNIAQRPRLF